MPINITKTEQLRLLDKFLVDNPELEELSAKLAVFNILNTLKIEQAEIRHSNVLAWLLDPEGSHGLGQSFVRRLLSSILIDNESGEIDITPAQVELIDLSDVEVYRERKNVDLLVLSNSNKWILLIENKINSRVSKHQLIKYYESVKGEFPAYRIIPVILTLEADDLSDVMEETGYISYSHAQLYHVAMHVVRQRKDRIPEDAKVFINHYLTALRRITMQDKDIEQLCKAIYKKHKDAIDLIVEWGATTQFVSAVEDFMSTNKKLVELCSGPRWFWFIHKDWEKKMPPCSNSWKHLSKPYPVACWFVYSQRSKKIGFIIEVGSIEDSSKRLRLIKEFEKEKFNIGKKAFRPEAKYTRVHSIYKKLMILTTLNKLDKLSMNFGKKVLQP